jgi:Cd2+/Zn2+-exporting ATPase
VGQRLHVRNSTPPALGVGDCASAVADTGMRAWLEHEEPIAVGERSLKRRQATVAVSGVALGVGLLADVLGGAAWAPWVFAAAFAIALPIPAVRAWRAIRVGSLDINTLMVIAASGAIAIGQLAEAATVVFLFAVAQMLETRTLDRARHAIRALMDLTPPTRSSATRGASVRSMWTRSSPARSSSSVPATKSRSTGKSSWGRAS